MTLDEIKNRIVALTEQHWNATGKAYLVSKLGADLGEVRLELQLQGHKLQPFVTVQMLGRVRVLPHPRHANIYGLVPVSVPIGNNTEPYFAEAPHGEGQDHATPRYLGPFWAAFARPLLDGHKRYLTVEGYPGFVELPANDQGPPGSYEVRPEDVPPDGIPNRDVEIMRRIDQWLARNGLERSKFVRQRHPPTQVVRDRETATGKSLLHRVLETLDERELAKNSLSLDVVAKLLRTDA